jgi:hypothetical protein
VLGIDDSTAPIAAKRQSFLDNVIAQFDGVEHGMIDADRTPGSYDRPYRASLGAAGTHTSSRGLPSINMAVEPLAIVRGQFRARTELRLLR